MNPSAVWLYYHDDHDLEAWVDGLIRYLCGLAWIGETDMSTIDETLADAVEMFIGYGNTCPNGVPLSGNTGYCSCETYQLSEWCRAYRKATK
jgi:hypothetical protein